MKNIIISLIAGAGIILQTSCSGFLDQKPSGQLEQSESLQSISDFHTAMNGIYTVWNMSGLYSGSLTLAPDLQCDLTYSVIGSSNQYGNMYAWDFSSGESYTVSVYSSLYKVISSVNMILENEKNLQLTDTTSQKEINNIIGSAYFSRALAYSELLKLYAPAYDPSKAESQPGISIWNSFSVGKPGRSSMAESYHQILSDLEKASKRITANAGNSNFISTAAVDALYARIYLYMQNYAEAVNAAGRVIANTAYTLADATNFDVTSGNATGIESTPFFKMWRNDISDEIIWKLNYSINNQPGSLGYIFCYNNGNSYRIDYSPASAILDMYDQNSDGRFYSYFKETEINGTPGYIINKYPGNPALQTGTAPVYSNMPKVFRLAEMYLIRAEAYAKSNQENLANTDLETLRTKRIKNYVHAGKSGESLLQEIKDERVKELYMEGHRLYDLKRYHQGFKRIPQFQSIPPYDQLNIVSTNHRFTWPIPSHEMEANQNMVQNPGY